MKAPLKIGWIILLVLCAFTWNDWTLEKSKDGVFVYTRPKSGSKFKEFKALTQVNADMNTCLNVMRDVAHFKDWMHDAEKVELLKKFNDNHFVYYVETKAPWPVENRDAIYEFKLFQLKNGNYKVTVKAASNDYKAKKKGITRIEELDGYWIFTAKEDHILAMFQMHANPGGNMPGWLVNSGVVDSPYHSMLNYRTYVEGKGSK